MRQSCRTWSTRHQCDGELHREAVLGMELEFPQATPIRLAVVSRDHDRKFARSLVGTSERNHQVVLHRTA